MAIRTIIFVRGSPPLMSQRSPCVGPLGSPLLGRGVILSLSRDFPSFKTVTRLTFLLSLRESLLSPVSGGDQLNISIVSSLRLMLISTRSAPGISPTKSAGWMLNTPPVTSVMSGKMFFALPLWARLGVSLALPPLLTAVLRNSSPASQNIFSG